MNKLIRTVISCAVMILLVQNGLYAQTTAPKWWFGVSGAANANFYDGTTQRLNNSLIVPAAFHKGKGIRPFGSLLLEYRPTAVWGAALNVGYDGRGGKFDDVIAPCNCPATLKTNTSYLTIEPTLRVNPWKGNFYLFAGPRLGINLQKDFNYTQLKQENTDAEFSEMRKNVISGQVGAGYDIPLSSADKQTKFVLSPFVSFQPYFGQDVRDIESWSNTTVRAGIALKFGRGRKTVAEVVATPVSAPDVNFYVRAPKPIVQKRLVSETLPLLSAVFFDENSTEIPNRYVKLSTAEAGNFKEVQLQQESAVNSAGRADRQLNVYYNILNILGDRMRTNSEINITLSGASLKGPSEGKVFAENIKQYLVSAFAISPTRIATNGRTKPVNPSEQPGGKKELVLLREGDRRVDIQSNSTALMMEVGGGTMKPIQINTTQGDATDNHVIFNVGNANVLKSYTIDVTDQNGASVQYGPFTRDKEIVLGQTILGNNKSGDYKVKMTGTRKDGTIISKESTLRIDSQVVEIEKGLRYSILFNFNKATTVATYEQFIENVVAPLIESGSTVIIHGHTDVIGGTEYNYKLSQQRAQEAQQLIERAVLKAGKTNVKFETVGVGEATDRSPFGNDKPEERFYNRTVIIDINPGK
jgi:outer membrane protein OmpA-like peptidoglycan-associated protein